MKKRSEGMDKQEIKTEKAWNFCMEGQLYGVLTQSTKVES